MLIRKYVSGLFFGSVLLFGTSMTAAADQIITVQGVPVGATVSLGGTVVPYKDVTFSAQIPGRIKSIAGEEGDQFEEGFDADRKSTRLNSSHRS